MRQTYAKCRLFIFAIAIACGGSSSAKETSAVPTIAFVGPLRAGIGITSLKKGMEAVGYIEGKTIRYLAQSTGDSHDELRFAVYHALSKKVDVIVAGGDNRTTHVAQSITTAVPIVFGSVNDPVEAGIVESLSRPGRNATGVANSVSQVMSKQMEIATEIFPDVGRVALLVPPDNLALAAQLEETAKHFKVSILRLAASSLAEIAGAVDALSAAKIKVLLVANDPIFVANAAYISKAAAKRGALSFCPLAHMARSGCFLSYGIDLAHNYERVATFVDKILKGHSPALLPVELPMKHYLIINMGVAKENGIALPASIVVRADEILD